MGACGSNQKAVDEQKERAVKAEAAAQSSAQELERARADADKREQKGEAAVEYVVRG